MKRTGKIVITLVSVLLLVLTAACAPVVTEEEEVVVEEEEEVVVTEEELVTPTPTGEKVNFRFLISDDVNAMEDFEHLYVTIDSIGLQQGGESGKWHLLDPISDPDGDGIDGIDLKPLKGPNALVIWSGYVDPGKYTKVFIYTDNVTGILAAPAEGETVDVKLPSEKLQISKPFTVSSDSVVNFVYDITVVKAGKSGKYILQPQIAQSGTNLDFNDVTPLATGGDTTPPVITLTGVTEGQVIVSPNTVTPEFTVSDEDPNPTVTATLDGEPFTSGTVVSEVGEYELVVTAIDASGNEAEVAVNFEIVEVEDTTPPVITLTGVADGQVIVSPNTVTPEFSVSDEDPNPTVTATLDGEPFTSGTVVSEVGEYELVVTAIDASGNEAEVAVNFEIVEE